MRRWKLVGTSAFILVLIALVSKTIFRDDFPNLNSSIFAKSAHRNAKAWTKEASYFNKTPHREYDVTALILARGGSKGIPKKNLVKIGNISLLGRSVDTLLRFGRFSSVWVSTDDKAIADEAVKRGAKVYWRSPESATDTAPSILGVQDFLLSHPNIELLALIQCTSPFLMPSFLAEAYDMVKWGQYSSVFSVTRKHDLRWKKREDGTVEALNFSPSHRPRRQDWAGELVENGMFYFATKQLLWNGVFQGGRCGVVEIPGNYSLQIDTKLDLDIAQTLFRLHSLL